MVARKLFEFTEYHSPDGEVYKFDTHDKFLISSTGYGMPPIKYLTQRGPFQHGNTIYDYRLDPRVIQLVHRRQACSREGYWSDRADLINLLRPNRQLAGTFNLGKLRKKFSDGSQRDIDVFIEQGPVFTPRDSAQWDEWAFTETLRFIAPDPTFYNPTQQSEAWSLSADDELVFDSTTIFDEDISMWRFGNTVINSNTDITYSGTWLSYPSFIIEGPCSGLLIRNTTTEEILRYEDSILLGETVTVSLEYGNKSAESNIYGSVIGNFSSDSDLVSFHIAPDPEAAGGVNTFNIVIPDPLVGTTSLTMYWYVRYIGI